MVKVSVVYDHDSSVLSPIYIALTAREPERRDWKPAYRDTVDRRKVVWVKSQTPPEGRSVWVKDRNGVRRATALIS